MSTIIINDVEYPSYATVEQATAYFNAKFGVTWSSISADDKKKLLVTATREIDKCLFQGIILEDTQELQFPRLLCGQTINPTDELISCCSEIAYAIYKIPSASLAMVTPGIEDLKSMSVGDTSITYKDGVSIETDVYSATAKPIIKKFLGEFLRGNVKIIL